MENYIVSARKYRPATFESVVGHCVLFFFFFFVISIG